MVLKRLLKKSLKSPWLFFLRKLVYALHNLIYYEPALVDPLIGELSGFLHAFMKQEHTQTHTRSLTKVTFS